MIAIIGILVSLLLPAVQAARESGRRTQCGNNLKQLGLAASRHVESIGWFPSGGWGAPWVGLPDRGFSPKQPGGYIYNLLPFLEQDALHDLGTTSSPTTAQPYDPNALAQRIKTPLAAVICPSRRNFQLGQFPGSYFNPFRYSAATPQCARNDYVINCGDAVISYFNQWATDLADGDNLSKNWPSPTSNASFTGISVARSAIPAAQVLDGLSNTYLIGEKNVNPDHYFDGLDIGDNETWSCADDLDLNRWTGTSQTGYQSPQPDTPGLLAYFNYGSTHPGVWQMVFCDGSVRSLNFNIDQETHRRLANRRDQQPLDTSKF